MATRGLGSRVLQADPRTARFRRARLRMCFVSILLAVVGVSAAPVAAADTTEALRAAIPAARGAGCGPIRSDPLIDEVAEVVNDSTDGYINFTTRAVPVTDALPVLADMGYVGATKTQILSGSAATAANSIKGALLQGFAVLPDCSFNAYGVATKYNAKKDVMLVTAVLVG